MNHTRTLSTEGALRALRDARDQGRQIVPLLGSGISIESGFPLAIHLVDHLVAVSSWLTHQGWADPRVFLQKYGWPGRHSAAADWLLVNEDWGWKRGPAANAAELASKFRAERRALYQRCMADEIRRYAPMAAARVDAAFDGRADRGEPGYTDYRSLLNYLTNRDPGLIDAYFDHFVRNRRPTTTHQFLAFVVQLLDVRMILTTNFDTMIETALRDEGLNPTVYEVTRGGDVPSAILVRKQRLAVVKLHGGAYSLRTGFDLDDPLPVPSLAEIRDYLEPRRRGDKPPLLLALGYSGSDRRVMDVVSDHLDQHVDGSMQVLWMSWTGSPPALLESAAKRFQPGDRHPAAVCRYRDGRLFFQELSQFVGRQHAVSRTHYEVLTHIPRVPDPAFAAPAFPAAVPGVGGSDVHRWTRHGETPVASTAATAAAATGSARTDENFVVFWAESEGCGTSELLAREVEDLGKTHHVIWVDASEVRSRATLFVLIEEAFRRQDRRLPPLTRPLMIEDVDFLAREDGAVQFANEKDDDTQKQRGVELDVATTWVLYAMRRGRYALAIDSMGEFAAGHPAIPVPAGADEAPQVDRAVEFLRRLCDQQDKYGESKILVAVTPNPVSGQTAEAIAARMVGAPEPRLAPPGRPPPPPARAAGDAPGRTSVEKLMALAGAKAADELARGSADAHTAGHAALLNRAVVLLLVVASFCRRPRSRTALRVLVFRAYRTYRKGRLRFPAFEDCFRAFGTLVTQEAARGTATRPKAAPGNPAPGNPAPADAADDERAIHAVCEELLGHAETIRIEGRGRDYTLLLRQEGGFYWMHHGVRNGIFRHVARCSADGTREATADAEPGGGADPAAAAAATPDPAPSPGSLQFTRHEVSELYDWMANFAHDDLFERSQDSSALIEYLFYRTASIQHAMEPGEANDRLRWLVGTLEQEREKMLARGRLTAVLNHIRTILRMLADPPDSAVGLTALAAAERGGFLYRMVRCYGDMLVACGHPRYALRYRVWQAELIRRGLKDEVLRRTGWVGAGSMMQHADAVANELMRWAREGLADARPPDRPALAGAELRRTMQTLVDLAVALSQSLLFRAVGDGEKDWAAPQGGQTGKAERALRWDLSQKLFKHPAVNPPPPPQDDSRPRAARPTDPRNAELLSRCALRRLEHALREYGHRRFYGDAAAAGHGDCATRPARAQGDPGTVADEPVPDACEGALKQLREGPATSRRRRHKAYLLLARARFAAEAEREFEAAQVYFRRAESAISRQSGPPERTAFAMTLLFEADAKLTEEACRRAEAAGKDETKLAELRTRQTLLNGAAARARAADATDANAQELEQLAARVGRRLRRCEERRAARVAGRLHHPGVEHVSARLWRETHVLLERAEAALAEGRVENRWRVLLYAMRADLYLRRYEHSGGDEQARQRYLLREAMTAFIAGRINTGLRTDRRLVMERLLGRIKKHLADPVPGGVELDTLPERVWWFFDEPPAASPVDNGAAGQTPTPAVPGGETDPSTAPVTAPPAGGPDPGAASHTPTASAPNVAAPRPPATGHAKGQVEKGNPDAGGAAEATAARQPPAAAGPHEPAGPQK